MGSKFTKYDLENVTDYIEFESFCHDVMSREGYKDIEPLGGGKDKGRDALHFNKSTDETTIFAYSVREDWEKKLNEDLQKIVKHGHSCDKVVFNTSGSPTATEKDTIKKNVKENYGWELEIFDLERISTLVDNHYQDLKDLHPSIFVFSLKFPDSEIPSAELNKKIYAEFLLELYKEWLEKFTPLLADHLEVETYLILAGSESDSRAISIEDVAEVAPISVILGESGAGKTTALWKIIVETSKAILDSKTEKIPILINLRGWAKDHNCRNLVQDQFELIETNSEAVETELTNGNCIILIDGLNELRPYEELRTEAYQDLQRFLDGYSRNSFVICCRATDYESRMLDLENRTGYRKPEHFEIRRMSREQIIDYVKRYFVDGLLKLAKNYY